MRVLFCLPLACALLLTNAQAQTAKESQAEAVKQLAKIGGWVRYDKKQPGKPPVGISFKNSIESSEVANAGLKHLPTLTSLEELSFYCIKAIDDGCLAHIKRLPKLKNLDLSYTKVTNAGLVHLKGLTSLRQLSFTYTKVTNAGLVHLKGLTNLEELSLSGPQLTPDGLAHLTGLKKIRKLEFHQARSLTVLMTARLRQDPTDSRNGPT